jgi:MraZ protein
VDILAHIFPKPTALVNLIGVHDCKLDAKGRMLVPSALKKQLMPYLSEGFVIKRSVFNQCLELHPKQEWDEVMGKVNKLNRFVKKNNDFIRMFSAGVRMVDVDGNGRLLIPRDLVNFAGLKKEIVLASAVNILEIWDKEQYEKVVNDPGIDFGALAEDVMGGQNEEQDD